MAPKSAKKRKVEGEQEASTSSEDVKKSRETRETTNGFETFINFPLDEPAKALLSQSASNRTIKRHAIQGYGKFLEYKGAGQDELFDPNVKLTPESFGWSEKLATNFGNLIESEVYPNEPERDAVFQAICKYMDLYAVTSSKEYRSIYTAHLMNHLIHYKNRIVKNKQKLEAAKTQGEIPEDLVESLRDQGFVRPIALVLCPFKKDAYDFVQRLKKIIYGDDSKTEVWNSHRFEAEFTGGAKDLTDKVDLPEDHKELLEGNNDDCFRLGIAISKKTLKLFEPFHLSDILLCSPLGLRMILNGDEGRENHLLSSLQMVIIDRADIMLQQNWEHITLIFDSIHSQPTKIDTDISRVRNLYLEGNAPHFSQLLLFSKHQNELFWALMLEKAKSHKGLVMHQPILKGNLSMIDVPCCQELHRFSVPKGSTQSDERLNYFRTLTGILPEGSCLFISSYFDFVRVRNFLKSRNDSFVSCHEYAPENKVLRARDMFFHGRKNALVVTERFHFFNRRILRVYIFFYFDFFLENLTFRELNN
ncbi:hypothetical protein WR25_02606 isoform B [Diploscapter pachys]|uniref:U3 small nucleolar RNA-associated protein 25 homolog n=1 Tax=Diploscapter pachys TaxID=2018661 RepID=A0A2A2LA66_9BILA|nr:hypothetical protein WR25_02606 isoform B [Diploscapter pachys]